MPLPSTLLARLKKRGILKQDDAGPEEEVIAEDYDDHSKKSTFILSNTDDMTDDPMEREKQEAMFENMLRENVQGDRDSALACPNKYNVYHVCTRFCHEHWSLKHPSPTVEKKRIKMLKKYPLLDNWKEVYDAGIGRHYYWHIGTEEVAWLPPSHPRSKVSMPATKLRGIWKESESKRIRITPKFDDGSDGEDDEEDDMDDDEDEEEDRKERERQRKQLERLRKSHVGRSRHEAELDPMDPASYSECGRGTWSTGLEKKGEAKTGADVTASGPLYQMRPYPSPGAVLRMNAGMKGPPPV